MGTTAAAPTRMVGVYTPPFSLHSTRTTSAATLVDGTAAGAVDTARSATDMAVKANVSDVSTQEHAG
jgi:hypothetical protein